MMLKGLGLGGLADNRQHPVTTHEFVRDVLRRAILSGELGGGTRLVQADIAAELRVSTTPVREALRDLAAENLVRIDPHRGAVVREVRLEELMEIYEIRKALEPLAVRKAAARITEAELALASSVQDEMDAETDPGRWVELNARFHGAIEQAGGSSRLAALVKSMQDASRQYVGHALLADPGRLPQGNREHRELLDALAAGDGDRAAAITTGHLDHTLNAVLAASAGDQPPPGRG